MENLKKLCSIPNSAELRQMILDNPELPLLIFVSEEAWCGEWSYNSVQPENTSCRVEELTLYKDVWMDKEDYEEKLTDDLSSLEENIGLSDEDYFKMISQKVAETEFVKAITVWLN